MKQISVIFGTRPEVIKCIPVILEAKNRGIQVKVIFTGQHREMALPLLNFFGIDIDINLDVMQPNQTLAGLSSRLLEQLEKHQEVIKASDVILVQGDTTSAFIGSYFGFLNKVPVGHIEAGLRTYNLQSPFPEEANRQLIGRFANFHFAPTKLATETLLQEAIAQDSVFNVGNTGIDTLLKVKERLDQDQDLVTEMARGLEIDLNRKIILVTAHRRENFGEGFDNICKAIRTIALKYPDIQIIYPVHLNPNVSDVVYKQLIQIENVRLIKPLDYITFVFLMSKATLILTDSGGVQEEAPSFCKPVVVMRNTTERMEGVQAGFSRLSGTSATKIVQDACELLDSGTTPQGENPYGDGKTSERIINVLIQKIRG